MARFTSKQGTPAARTWGCVAVAFLGTLNIPVFYEVATDNHGFGNSILSLVSLVALTVLYRHVLERADRRLIVVSGVVGVVFSAFTLAGVDLVRHGSTLLFRPVTQARIILMAPMFASLVALAILALPRANQWLQAILAEPRHASRLGSRGTFAATWALIFVAWLPAFAASYPGIFGYDSIYQLDYWITGEISLHHPLIHTYLLGFFVSTVGGWLGSLEAGMCCYSIFQMLCMSAFFAGVCRHLRTRGVARVVRLAFLLLFMFLPTNALLSFSSTKDVLFAALFALMVLQLARLAAKPDLLHDLRFCGLLVLASLAQAMFRNQGIYVFVFAMVFALVLLRHEWRRLAAVTAVTLVAFALYSGPVTSLLGGVPATSRGELLSVPCMQLSRAACYDADELTSEQLEQIAAYVPDYDDYAEVGQVALADPVKRDFNSDLFSADPAAFARLWLSVGLRCPVTYLDAWCRMSIGLWYPNMAYPDPQAWHPYWEYRSTPEVDGLVTVGRSTPPAFQRLADFYDRLTYEAIYQRVPVVAMLFSSGLPFWLLVGYLAACVYYRRYTLMLPGFAVFGLWGTLMLGPVVLYRYVYPMVTCIPVLTSVALMGFGDGARDGE